MGWKRIVQSIVYLTFLWSIFFLLFLCLPKVFYGKQYPVQFCGSVFLILPKFVVLHSLKVLPLAKSKWHIASIISVFSLKLKDLYAWNNCSHVLPTFEYCCLNRFYNPYQSTLIGSNEWYHSLASPNSVRQNIWTLTPSTKWCAFIQSFELSRCASASSSGFPENSGLEFDQFTCTTCCCWPAWSWICYGCCGCCYSCYCCCSCCCWFGLGAGTLPLWLAIFILCDIYSNPNI